MSNGSDDIIIIGHKANGSESSQYFVSLSAAEAALATLKAQTVQNPDFIAALQDAINFVTG